jgi:hypothetical protein
MIKNLFIKSKIFTPLRVLGLAMGSCALLLISLLAYHGICHSQTEKECNPINREEKLTDLTSTPLFIYVIASSLAQDK